MNNIQNKATGGLGRNYIWILFGILIIALICNHSSIKSETARCDNNKAIALLKEQNIDDLKQATEEFMLQKTGKNYKIVFSDELSSNKQYDTEFAKFRYGDEENNIKAVYNKSHALIEYKNKDINEVQCSIPVTFTQFSAGDKKATLSGTVFYTIHANDKGYMKVSATPIKDMFRSNFKPIYNKKEEQYVQFTYKTGEGETIDKINNLPIEEFGDFFNPLNY